MEPRRDIESDVPAARSTFSLDGNGASRAVKRPRPVKSCWECRKRKLRCDRLPICSQCQKSMRSCRYSDPDNASDGSDGEMGERPVKRVARPSIGPAKHEESPAAHRAPPSFNGSEPPQTVPNAVFLEEMAARLERLEHHLLMDKRSPTESTASRHRNSRTRVSALPLTIRGLSVKGVFRTRYFGQNSTKVLLNLFDEAKDYMRNMAKQDGAKELFFSLQHVYKTLQKEHRKALEPITVFVDSMMPVQKRMADILPKKPVCDRLLEAYINLSEGLYRVVHIPSFRKEYEQYWEGIGSHEAFLPRLLCMMSIASRFETETRGLSHDRSDSVHVPTACRLVRSWLDDLRGKQLVDFNTLQTEIILLHVQRTIMPRNQDSWTQLGLIVRMAMTMGLHRDPEEFPQLTPFLGEYRRRLWYTIMDMDLHVSMACNLPCATREGEYTCRPPRNLNDEDLFQEMQLLPESKPVEVYTQNQMQVCAASTIPWRIKVSGIISRLDTIQDYAEVLETGNKLERLIDDINYLFPRHASLDPDQKFKAWRDRALLDMHVRRPLLDLYRPFALSSLNCPSQISTSYLKSCMMILTYMEELDPRMPGYKDVRHMYQLVLKHDIIQAAFSVCFYIKQATEKSRNSGRRWMSPPEIFSNGSDDGPMWSATTLIRTVENTLDSLIGLIRDSSSDIRDVVALSIVLNSVQAVSPEQKLENIKSGVKRVLDASLQVLASKSDNLTCRPVRICTPKPKKNKLTQSVKMAQASVLTAPIDNRRSHAPFPTDDSFFPELSDEFPMWDSFLDCWSATPPKDQP